MSSQILEGFLDIEPFAAQVERDPRTVRRWMDEVDGLPYTKIGNRRLIHIETARQWILSRIRRPNPRRQQSAEQTAA
jgi:hypothetical protein